MKHLFSPWRSQYITHAKPSETQSNLQSIFSNIPKELDEEKLVLFRAEHAFIIMNLFPYNPGHLMVIPYLQTNSIAILSQPARLEIMNLIELSIRVLKTVCHPDGFNVGLNLGQVAGGSISEHIHFHIVPRWTGDTNFMPTTADIKVVSIHIKELYFKLKAEFEISKM